jgi:hypothetical protein
MLRFEILFSRFCSLRNGAIFKPVGRVVKSGSAETASIFYPLSTMIDAGQVCKAGPEAATERRIQSNQPHLHCSFRRFSAQKPEAVLSSTWIKRRRSTSVPLTQNRPAAKDVLIQLLNPHRALQVMRDRGAGSVLVTDKDLVTGIFTERDYLTKVTERTCPRLLIKSFGHYLAVADCCEGQGISNNLDKRRHE